MASVPDAHLVGLASAAVQIASQQLNASDAGSCRIASRQFNTVSACITPDSMLQIVASGFQKSLTAENDESHAGNSSQGKLSQSVQSLTLNAVVGTAEHIPLSPTAAGLVRVGTGHHTAKVYIDVNHEYTDNTWQQLFGALAAIPTLSSLTVTECRSLASLTPLARDLLDHRCYQSGLPQSAQAALSAGGASPDPSTGIIHGAAGNWLPILASYLKWPASLSKLQLELAAPLPVQHQHQLAQLRSLQQLVLKQTANWPWSFGRRGPPGAVQRRACGGDFTCIEPALVPAAFGKLSQLQKLTSMACTVALAESGNAEAAIAAQQVFCQLGSTLTQLTFGTSDRSRQLSLSAPLRHMPRLQALTCLPGFLIDTETDPEDSPDVAQAASTDHDSSNNSSASSTSTQSGPGEAVASSSSGSSRSDGVGRSSSTAGPTLAAPLSQIVLNEGRDHRALLQKLLAAPSRATQLQHLELNTPQDSVPFDLLQQLRGLRQLSATVTSQDAIQHFSSASNRVESNTQLQALTMTLISSAAQADFAEFPAIGLRWVFAAMALVVSLTSLHIKGNAAELDPFCDFAIIAETLPSLRQFSYTGAVSTTTSQETVLQLPSNLQGLTVVIPSDRAEPSFTVSAACLPAGLTSLGFEGASVVTGTEQGVPWMSGTHSPANVPDLKSLKIAAPINTFLAAFRNCCHLQMLDLQSSIAADYRHLDSLKALPTLCPYITSLKLNINFIPSKGKWLDPDDEDAAAQDKACALPQIMPGIVGLTGLKDLNLRCMDRFYHACRFRSLNKLRRLQLLELNVLIRAFTAPQLETASAEMSTSFLAFKENDLQQFMASDESEDSVQQLEASDAVTRGTAAVAASLAAALPDCRALRRLTLHQVTEAEAVKQLQALMPNLLIDVHSSERDKPCTRTG